MPQNHPQPEKLRHVVNTPQASPNNSGLSAAVQVLRLPPAVYLFSVTSTGPVAPRTNGHLSVPAVHVGLAPGVRPDQVEFIAGPSNHGEWLFAPGDILVAKVSSADVTLVLTSVRAPGGEILSIQVESLNASVETPDESAGEQAVDVEPAAVPVQPASDQPLAIQIAAHIRTRGDMRFVDVPWAGRVGPGLWMESFSLRPLEQFTAQDIEYKGLTATGFETAWLSDDKMCGTKGMALPLVGFAVRLKPGALTAAYDCEYSGYFQSGVTVGPVRNGAPCRSNVANDSLEGIQVRIVKRNAASHQGNGVAKARVAPSRETKLPSVKSARGRTTRDRPPSQSKRRRSTRRP
jgi:hypothetical protein